MLEASFRVLRLLKHRQPMKSLSLAFSTLSVSPMLLEFGQLTLNSIGYQFCLTQRALRGILNQNLDASWQKLTPRCLAAIIDSQLPSPKLSLKMPPKLPLPHKRGLFSSFKNCPRGEGNCAAIERQKLSRGNFCLGASRCLSRPTG